MMAAKLQPPRVEEGFARIRSSGANIRIGAAVTRLSSAERVPAPSLDEVLAADMAGGVDVRFDSDTHESRIEVVCYDGQPHPDIREESR